MQPIEVHPPYPGQTRLEVLAVAEELVQAAVEFGFVLERHTVVDEPGEPIRVVIRLAWSPERVIGGVL